jgi:hypothetical protein
VNGDEIHKSHWENREGVESRKIRSQNTCLMRMEKRYEALPFLPTKDQETRVQSLRLKASGIFF